MVKKKIISKQDVTSLFMEYILENNELPKSVHIFSKLNGFEEAKFYEYFGSFEAIEKYVFAAFFENTKNTLNKSDEYKSFDARNRLLSFYYTFFENLTANRSYIMYTLHKYKNSLKDLGLLAQLKKHFANYIDELDIEVLDINQEKINKFQKHALQKAAWLQLLSTIKFWMDDTSASFEKTDLLIEKSVNMSFDVLNVTPLKSVIDFGKFIFKETMNKA